MSKPLSGPPTGASCRHTCVVGVDGDGGSRGPVLLRFVQSCRTEPGCWIRMNQAHGGRALICWFQWCIWDSCWPNLWQWLWQCVYNIFINQCVYYTYSGWKFNSFQPTFTYSLYCMTVVSAGHLWKRQRVMHPKGVANITCTNQSAKNNEFTKKWDCRRHHLTCDIYSSRRSLHQQICTKNDHYFVWSHVSLSLSPSISLLKSVFKSRYTSLVQKNNVASLPPKSPKFEDDVPQHRVFTVFTPTPYQVHLELTVPVLQQEYNPQKTTGGSWKWTLILVSRLCKSKQLSSVSDFTTHHWATWIHCNIPKKLISVSFYCKSMYT